MSPETRAKIAESMRRSHAERGHKVKPLEQPLVTVLCSVPGCGKPPREDSVQCERHFQKQQRANVRYRAKATTAIKEIVNPDYGNTWKRNIIAELFNQKSALEQKMRDLDHAIGTIQAL